MQKVVIFILGILIGCSLIFLIPEESDDNFMTRDVFYNMQNYFDTEIDKCELLKLKIVEIELDIEKESTTTKKIDLFNHKFINKKNCNGNEFNLVFGNLDDDLNNTIHFDLSEYDNAPYFFEFYDVAGDAIFTNGER